MLNQVILVGRLMNNPEAILLDDGRKKTTITLEIQRNYRNAETGEYDSDKVECTLWNGIAENTIAYCKQGSVIGVKARLQTTDGIIEVIAEKITFINSKQS